MLSTHVFTESALHRRRTMPEKKSLHLRATLACAVLLCLSLATSAQQQQATPQTTSPTPTPENPEDATTETKSFERLEWRSIGPANMRRRIADNEGVPGNPDPL